MQKATSSQAYLSNKGNYTIFRFDKHVIRFRTSSQLER